MIRLTSSGSFSKTEAFLKKMLRLNIVSVLHSAGKKGVSALKSATPIQTGLTAASWDYEVTARGGIYEVAWTNSDVESSFPVAIMLQYGHGTGTGGYIQGIDYINPAIRPIFDAIANEVWEAVNSA